MDRSRRSDKTATADGRAAIGIDVGGARKGFHAVVVADEQYAGHCVTTNVRELADWCCKTARATVIAVDAPCHWSLDGRARTAERQLMENGIWCFSTPTRQRALEHPKDHYGWMLQGEKLFKALEETHPLCSRLPTRNQRCCFETFPHAITWYLTNGQCRASRKRTERRRLLQQAGIDLTKLTNIDLVDAALCALTAYYAATGGNLVSYGETKTGLIVVPASFKQ